MGWFKKTTTATIVPTANESKDSSVADIIGVYSQKAQTTVAESSLEGNDLLKDLRECSRNFSKAYYLYENDKDKLEEAIKIVSDKKSTFYSLGLTNSKDYQELEEKDKALKKAKSDSDIWRMRDEFKDDLDHVMGKFLNISYNDFLRLAAKYDLSLHPMHDFDGNLKDGMVETLRLIQRQISGEYKQGNDPDTYKSCPRLKQTFFRIWEDDMNDILSLPAHRPLFVDHDREKDALLLCTLERYKKKALLYFELGDRYNGWSSGIDPVGIKDLVIFPVEKACEKLGITDPKILENINPVQVERNRPLLLKGPDLDIAVFLFTDGVILYDTIGRGQPSLHR